MTRAQFLRTAAGTATAFWVLNLVHGLDQWGDAAALPVNPDLGAACELLDRHPFVMDVQLHHVDLNLPDPSRFCFIRFGERGQDASKPCAERTQLLGQANFVQEAFVGSETDVGVIIRPEPLRRDRQQLRAHLPREPREGRLLHRAAARDPRLAEHPVGNRLRVVGVAAVADRRLRDAAHPRPHAGALRLPAAHAQGEASLGLNAARLYGVDPRARRCAIAADRIALERAARGGFRAGRSLRAYGPRTRRELLALLRFGAGRAG